MKLPHKVPVGTIYFLSSEVDFSSIYSWLEENVGERSVDWDFTYYGVTGYYHFRDEEYAVAFIIKYSHL
jgi:hypothetical protein